MNIYTKGIIVIVFIAFGLIGIFKRDWFFEKKCPLEYDLKYIKPLEIKSIVKKKYQIPMGKSQGLDLLNYTDSLINGIYFSNTGDIMYEVSVGDSIIKRTGLLDVLLIKKNGERKLFNHKCL